MLVSLHIHQLKHRLPSPYGKNVNAKKPLAFLKKNGHTNDDFPCFQSKNNKFCEKATKNIDNVISQ